MRRGAAIRLSWLAVAEPQRRWTVDEVADYLKSNQQTVRNMIDRGELRPIRIGQRRVCIRQSELDRLIVAGESAPGDMPFETELALAALTSEQPSRTDSSTPSGGDDAERLAEGLQNAAR
jgi:excisionase family DNA binding protein